MKDKFNEMFGVYSAAEKITNLICSLVWPPIPGIASEPSNVVSSYLEFANRGIIDTLRDAVRDSAVLCPDLRDIAEKLNCYLSDFQSECEILNTRAESGDIFAEKIVSLIDKYVFDGIIEASEKYPFVNDSSYSYYCEFVDGDGLIQGTPLGAYNVPGYFRIIHNPLAWFMNALTEEIFHYEDESEESVGAFAEFAKMLMASNCDSSNRIYQRINAVLPVLYAVHDINVFLVSHYDSSKSGSVNIIEECLRKGHKKFEICDKCAEINGACCSPESENFEVISSRCLFIEYKNLLSKYHYAELEPVIENLGIIINELSKFQSCYDQHESGYKPFDFTNDYNSVFYTQMKDLTHYPSFGSGKSFIGYALGELDIDKSIAINALEACLIEMPILDVIIGSYGHPEYAVEHDSMVEAIKAIIS